MDYRLNNEAIVACVAVQVVNNGCKKLPAVVILTNLLMKDRERKKAKQASEAETISEVLSQVDGGLLTIIMNSITMLVKGGCMTFVQNELSLTENGMAMCQKMNDGRSQMLNNIVKDIPAIINKIEVMGVSIDRKYLIEL